MYMYIYWEYWCISWVWEEKRGQKEWIFGTWNLNICEYSICRISRGLRWFFGYSICPLPNFRIFYVLVSYYMYRPRKLRWWFQTFFMFTPIMAQFDLRIFFKWVVEPPTRKVLNLTSWSSHRIHVWYIYLHENHKNQPNVGKQYTSPMDPMGMEIPINGRTWMGPVIFIFG